MRYGYYPGCSLGCTARPYGTSTEAIVGLLGIELEEVEDWNCCGATEYFSLNKAAAYALVGRNLALASSQDNIEQLTTPCNACYLNLKKTDYYMGKYPKLDKLTNEALAAGGLSYTPGSLRIRHLIDIIINDVGYDSLADKVVRPLTGVRLAPYYGCLITRPEISEEPLDDFEQPTFLDKLLATLGADVADYPLKTQCCGGHMTQIDTEAGHPLIHNLLQNANENNADAIVTLCPMCHLNLDAYQTHVIRHFDTTFKIPVLYFTQMIGLALGIEPKELGIGQEFVSAAEMIKKIGTEPEVPEPVKPRRKKEDKSLPMPGKRVEG